MTTVRVTEHLKRAEAINYFCDGDERTISLTDLEDLAEILTGVEGSRQLTDEEICLATIFDAYPDLASMVGQSETYPA